MHKTKLVDWCDVVPNLVVGIEIFNFCLYLTREKWSNHDSKNCSEIRTVTW